MDYLSLDYLKKKSDLGFSKKVLDYPERIIQFGTNLLLKGLPDFIVDQANKNDSFQGKIVMIDSSESPDAMESFTRQDSLYTIATRGTANKRMVDKQDICTAISRVLMAKNQWPEIIELSRKESIDYVFSNIIDETIEESEKISPSRCPQSFAGKIVAILKSRFEYFNGDLSKGLIFLPSEPISNNGNKLKERVFQLAEENFKDLAFLAWLKSANTFCNTAMDRIVPGNMDYKLPYTDNNFIAVEPYGQWLIEGDQSIKKELPFCYPESGASVLPSIENHKLGLLSAAHSFSSAFAFLSGYNLVKNSMKNDSFYAFIETLLAEEILVEMPASSEKNELIENTLDRLRNPLLNHKWLLICKEQSLKLSTRCLPLIKSYVSRKGEIPKLMLRGFTAGLMFLKPTSEEEGKFYGKKANDNYLIQDPNAEFFYQVWTSDNSEKEKISKILENENLWGENLNNLENFTELIYYTFSTFGEKGIDKTILETIS